MLKKPLFTFLLISILFSCKPKQLTQKIDDDFVVHGWTMEKDVILRFIDGFDNNQNNWKTEEKKNQERFFRAGQYHIINRETENFVYETKEFNLNKDENFAIQVNFTFQWDTDGEAYIIYGEDKSSNSFYYVKLSNKENSRIHIGKIIDGGQGQEIQVQGDVKSIGKQNRIAIMKYGNELKFNVNDNFVYTKNFEPFFGKGIGIGCENIQNISFNLFSVNQQKSQNPDFVPPLP